MCWVVHEPSAVKGTGLCTRIRLVAVHGRKTRARTFKMASCSSWDKARSTISCKRRAHAIGHNGDKLGQSVPRSTVSRIGKPVCLFFERCKNGTREAGQYLPLMCRQCSRVANCRLAPKRVPRVSDADRTDTHQQAMLLCMWLKTATASLVLRTMYLVALLFEGLLGSVFQAQSRF